MSSVSSSTFNVDSIDSSKLKIQIIAYDSYQCAPTALDKPGFTLNGRELSPGSKRPPSFPHVPVLRIFGKLQTGHTCLLHVHNVFPYIFIPYLGNAPKDAADLNAKLMNLKKEIELQMVLSYQRQQSDFTDDGDRGSDYNHEEDRRTPSTKRQRKEDSPESRSFLADLSLVKGVPFYNYHAGYAPFVKISCLSPRYAVRLTRLLHEGRVFGRPIQPFESHLPYTFQFLLDYNCYSCDWVSLSKFFWRSPLIMTGNREDYQLYFDTDFGEFNKAKYTDDLKKMLGAYVTSGSDSHWNILDSEKFPRMGRTLLEIDTSASWILNRYYIDERPIHDILFEKLPSGSERYINSTKALLEDVEFQRKERGIPDDPHAKLFDDLDRQFDSEKWVEVDELRELFKYCCDLSENAFKKTFAYRKMDSGSVIPEHSWVKDFPTSFGSIEQNRVIPALSAFDTVAVSLSLSSTGSKEDSLVNLNGDAMHSSPDKISQSLLNSVIENDHFEESLSDSESVESLSDIDVDEPAEPEATNEADSMSAPGNNNSASFLDTTDADQTDLRLFEATQKQHVDSSMVGLTQPPLSQLSVKSIDSFNLYPVLSDVESTECIYSLRARAPRYRSNDAFMNSYETDYGRLKIDYPEPFYSKRSNYDPDPFYFAGKKFQLKCLDLQGLEEYNSVLAPSTQSSFIQENKSSVGTLWEYAKHPPTFAEVECFSDDYRNMNDLLSSEIEPITQRIKGYKYSSAQTPVERKYTNYSKLIMLQMEIHVNTRGQFKPDPEKDDVGAIFWRFDKDNYPVSIDLPEAGIFIVNGTPGINVDSLSDVPVRLFDDEEEMFAGLAGLVELIDPDILAGYEIHALSWGYVIERCTKEYDIDLPSRLSRVAGKHNNRMGDHYGYTHASGIRITGRHMLNIWRRLRSELRLGKYSFENVVFHILHQRVPHFSHQTLTKWFNDDRDNLLSSVLCYFTERVRLTQKLVDQLELIEQITEQSRMIGIDFYSIIYRGSQFKVESIMVRIAKAEDYILISPSKKQVFEQEALECVPLILEPESAFYKSPLVVLDFQSLYPSIIIAYNYCFSTLLGKLRGFDPDKYQALGVTKQKLPKGLLKVIEKYVNLSPNGLMFAKSEVRKSLLAKMLTEILDARILVKDTMKKVHDDRELNSLYHNRQLALKMLANVTYGYTSATFSGRMPHAAVADAIVSSGRETLLRAISEIESNEKWGAKVVYGDTDSLFIYLPGKTKQDAFKIGKAMADHITHINPAPMKLKFEKVYHPCILVSKKRYIGWMYEYEEQKEPIFDAKGIETVRRDGIPAQQKIVEKAITLLFKSLDISQVKSYVLEQFSKLMRGQVNLQDFLFAKEVRLGTYKNEAYMPPGAKISKEKVSVDKRAAPQYKERVFYVVKKGFKGQKLKDRCVSPDDFLKTKNAELDSEYYITKVLVPPLARIFNLLGVDVSRWYTEMPKSISYGDKVFKTLNLRSGECLCCGKPTDLRGRVCGLCLSNRQQTSLRLRAKLKFKQKRVRDISTVCAECSKRSTCNNSVQQQYSLDCDSEDCPVFYDRHKAIEQLNKLSDDLSGLQQEW